MVSPTLIHYKINPIPEVLQVNMIQEEETGPTGYPDYPSIT